MSIAQSFEARSYLHVVYRETAGVTQSSLEAFRKLRPDMGVIDRLYFLFQDGPDWNYLVYLVNVDRDAWIFDGFAWGYGGEGPRGFMALLDDLGWCRPRSGQMPGPNTVGIWRLTEQGVVYTILFPEANPI